MIIRSKIILVHLMLFCIPSLAFAQKDTTSATKRNFYASDLNFALNSNQFFGAGSAYGNYGIGAKRNFRVLYGIRLNYFNSSKTDFITAPAKLNSGCQGPTVIFKENIEENLDTLTLNEYSNFFANVFIGFKYQISKRFDLGFTIDLAGFSIGKKQSGVFQASEDASLNGTVQNAEPSPFNLLLVSDNDLGSLNSELYIKYLLNNHWSIKVGATFVFNEITTDQKLTFDNDRFRNKSLMPLIGLSYKF